MSGTFIADNAVWISIAGAGAVILALVCCLCCCWCRRRRARRAKASTGHIRIPESAAEYAEATTPEDRAGSLVHVPTRRGSQMGEAESTELVRSPLPEFAPPTPVYSRRAVIASSQLATESRSSQPPSRRVLRRPRSSTNDSSNRSRSAGRESSSAVGTPQITIIPDMTATASETPLLPSPLPRAAAPALIYCPRPISPPPYSFVEMPSGATTEGQEHRASLLRTGSNMVSPLPDYTSRVSTPVGVRTDTPLFLEIYSRA